MNARHDPDRSAHPRGPVHAVRRALAPAALELQGEAARLGDENAALRQRVDELEQRLHAAESALEQVDQLAGAVADLRDGLHQERRLSLRLAELTDLVTELVLPLHDRQIDPDVLARLRPDSL